MRLVFQITQKMCVIYPDSLGKLNLIEKTIPNKRTSPNQDIFNN